MLAAAEVPDRLSLASVERGFELLVLPEFFKASLERIQVLNTYEGLRQTVPVIYDTLRKNVFPDI